MDFSAWKHYCRLYQGARFRFVLNIFLSVFQSIAVLFIALMIRFVFDEAIPEQNVAQLIWLCAFMLALYILTGGLTLWTRYLSLSTTKMAIKRIRDEIVGKIYGLPRSYFSQTDRMGLHTRIVQDTLRVDVMSNALVALFFPAMLISAGLIGILLYLNIFLFLAMTSIIPFLFIFNRKLGSQLKNKINSYHAYFEVFSKRISTILKTIDLTRIQSHERQEVSDQKKIHDNLRKRSQTQAWYNAAYRIIQKTAIASVGTLILVVGGIFVITDKMTLGELVSFFAAMGLLRNHLLTMTGVIPDIVEGNESLKRIYRCLTVRMNLPYQGRRKIRFNGQISLQAVDFGYGCRRVLNNITFNLTPRQITCLKGPNGSGKSTIAHLILGFYRPDKGRIFADGQPYEKLDMFFLRRYFGVVQQDPIIFPGTIYENMTYGFSKVKDEDIRNVLKLTLCEEFIASLPKGLHTRLEEKGHTLSGGEIQRISIARALLGNYKLLILDEPANHLDDEVMKRILTNIRNLKSRPTVMIISLNKQVANLADSVLVLKNGEIVWG